MIIILRFWIVVVCTFILVPQSRGDDFPVPYNTEKDPGHPMPPDQAAASFRAPEGFTVSVFAAEPDVRNPIAMSWDHKGRLWIAENYTYAERGTRFDLRLRDRVLILEDRDGDGKAETRKVFDDSTQRLTGIEVGRGGVWLMCPPQLLFIPDRNGDDKPDGPAEVVLDGFTVPAENYHNLANGLRWGPDGWLYGRCGASAPGRIGTPETPDSGRVPLRGGLWRFDLKSKRFEVLAHGTTNPWGHDWNAWGEAFFINTVNGHLWHAVAGMHFVRPHTIDPNPSVYQPIDQHADHFHWDATKVWSDSRTASGEHDRRGGGHAHSGLMIYQGDQWPASYRDKLFTLNFHGKRVNVDRLERVGGGYVGKHDPDILFARDPWFRGIELGAGPDGSVFILDWSDAGECHESTGVHRTSGRVYRVSHGLVEAKTKKTELDLSKLDATELAKLSSSTNEWLVRQGRLVLAERHARGVKQDDAKTVLLDQLSQTRPETVLRAIWALNAIESLNDRLLLSLLEHEHESVRVWSIRFLLDGPLDDIDSHRVGPETVLKYDVWEAILRHASVDKSGLVRLILASSLQRLDDGHRLELATKLVAHVEDAGDHNIPLLVWQGLIPLAERNPKGLAQLAKGCALPMTRRFIARRLAESIDTKPEAVAELVKVIAQGSSSSRLDMLGGLTDGLRGRRKAAKPTGWDELVETLNKQEPAATRDLARDLSVVFGVGRALDEVRRLALDETAPLETRRSALKSLIESRPDDLRSICERLLTVKFLNATAARGLALFDDPAVAKSLANQYRSFHPSDRPALLDTLVSRPKFAQALLEAMAAGKVDRSELTPFHARQLRSLNDPALTKRLAEVWGDLRDSAPEKAAIMARLKKELTAKTLATGDPRQGRALFAKACASCHRLYGEGGQIGPDLTGSGRDNLDYLLENVVDPAATVTIDFRMVVVALTDGRVLNGIVKARNQRTLTLQTQNELVVLDRKEIEAEKPTTSSLMPDGLLDTLKKAEVVDLFAYLMGRTQVPLPTGSSPAAERAVEK